jgi:hypothetical protein
MRQSDSGIPMADVEISVADGGFDFGLNGTRGPDEHPTPPPNPQPSASKEQFTFTLNSKPMSSLVGPDGKSYSAFSGLGKEADDPSKTADAGAGPLPKGKYYIVDRPEGGAVGHFISWLRNKNTWFALYRDDDKIDDQTKVNGVTRGQFRLHPKGPLGISEGCITVNEQKAYNALRQQLLTIQKETIPGTSLQYYGTVTVK